MRRYFRDGEDASARKAPAKRTGKLDPLRIYP
jgi:hypothetical protein